MELFEKVKSAGVSVPIAVVAVPTSNQVVPLVAFQMPAPPRPATEPFASQKTFAARAGATYDTLNSAAATISEARERGRFLPAEGILRVVKAEKD